MLPLQPVILLSLDFPKCFDTIDPTLGLRCLQYFGCPAPVLKMLRIVWHQPRWLYQVVSAWKRSTLQPEGSAIFTSTVVTCLWYGMHLHSAEGSSFVSPSTSSLTFLFKPLWPLVKKLYNFEFSVSWQF